MTAEGTMTPDQTSRRHWWDRMQRLMLSGATPEQAAATVAPTLDSSERHSLAAGWLEHQLLPILDPAGDVYLPAQEVIKQAAELLARHLEDIPIPRSEQALRRMLVQASIPDSPPAPLIFAAGCRELAAGLRAALHSGDQDVMQHAALEAVAGLDDLEKRLRDENR